MKDIIYDFLKNERGLLITNKGVGKTQALMHILFNNPKAILLVSSEAAKQDFIGWYTNYEANLNPYPYIPRFNNLSTRILTIIDKKTDLENLYIDEYFYCNLIGVTNFKAAVTSMKFPVKIKKIKQFYNPANINASKYSLGYYQFQLTHGLFLDE